LIVDDANELQVGLLQADISDFGELARPEKDDALRPAPGLARGAGAGYRRKAVPHPVASFDVEAHRMLQVGIRHPDLFCNACRCKQISDTIPTHTDHAYPAFGYQPF